MSGQTTMLRLLGKFAASPSRFRHVREIFRHFLRFSLIFFLLDENKSHSLSIAMKNRPLRVPTPIAFFFSLGTFLPIAEAEPRSETVQQMEEIEVRADYDTQVEGPFLPDVEGTRINAGKKTSNIRLQELHGERCSL